MNIVSIAARPSRCLCARAPLGGRERERTQPPLAAAEREEPQPACGLAPPYRHRRTQATPSQNAAEPAGQEERAEQKSSAPCAQIPTPPTGKAVVGAQSPARAGPGAAAPPTRAGMVAYGLPSTDPAD
jgi:hypothetical protein